MCWWSETHAFIRVCLPNNLGQGFWTYFLIGDCLKLRAAHHPKLDHLIDCIVFAAVARPGRASAPSMSSGGDLDGDVDQAGLMLSLIYVQVIDILCAGILILYRLLWFRYVQSRSLKSSALSDAPP